MERDFAERVRLSVGAAVGALLLVAAVVLLAKVLLLFFAAVLFAIYLRGAARLLERAGLGERWSIAVAILGTFTVVVAIALFIYPSFASQASRLSEEASAAVDQLSNAAQSRFGVSLETARREALSHFGGSGGQMLEKIFGLTSGVLWILGSIALVVAIGIYLAIDPELYQRGAVSLLPASSRERARRILGGIGETLGWWLLGRLTAMVLVGILTGAGLWGLGVPLAFALTVVTVILGWIPNIGAVLSALPAMLLAFPVGPYMPIYVALLYLTIQMLEGYLVTPMIQKRAVSLPPALILMSQVCMGALLGTLGLALATPLAAAALTVHREWGSAPQPRGDAASSV